MRRSRPDEPTVEERVQAAVDRVKLIAKNPAMARKAVLPTKPERRPQKSRAPR
jgi:hypothetical protein